MPESLDEQIKREYERHRRRRSSLGRDEPPRSLSATIAALARLRYTPILIMEAFLKARKKSSHTTTEFAFDRSTRSYE